MDLQRFTPERPRHKGRNHSCVGVVSWLQRAKNIEEAKGDYREVERPSVGQGVRLCSELARRVRAHRKGRHVLSLWERRVGTVDRRGRGDDHLWTPVSTSCLEDIHGAGRIHRVGSHRIGK